jgi:hypothetical protein
MHKCRLETRRLHFASGWAAVAAALVAAGSACAAAQQPGQQTFPSASKACDALVGALQSNNEQELLNVLGGDAKNILSSGDPVEDRDRRAQFIEKYKQMHRLVAEPDGTTTLYIGAENWPAPIPLAHKGTAWYFDTPAGEKEILYRRVGENELTVILVCRELVDAENEYESHPHDDETARQFAQHLNSTPGKQDGLYWPASSGEQESPVGPLVASAASEGYNFPADRKQEPFHGYYFRILTAQRGGASGGNHSYVVNGKMTGGFAFVAYPAEYRDSGVMTFIVDRDGIVYQKDLGPRTEEIAKSMKAYDRDASWRKAD